MNVKSKEKKENSAIELVIQVGAEEFEAAIEKVYRKNRGRIQVPGFRKGHAPRKIIEGMYGAGVFYEDAIDELYPSAYTQAIEQEDLEPVAFPKIEVTEVGKEGFTFKALVTLKPDCKLKSYKGLAAVKEEVKVTDADVDNELKPYIQRATRLVDVKRKAKKGDTAVIDFEGFVDGVAFEGGKGENHPLELGSGTFIPGFEDQLIGTKAGDEKDVNVTFPEEYTPDLAGKAAVFKVKVHEVKEPQAPKLDDEFAKDVSEFDTLAEFKADLKKQITERKEHAAGHAFEDSVMDSLIAELEVKLPDAMVEYRADQILREYADRFESQGIPFPQYLQMTGQSMDMMRVQAAEAAGHQIKSEMALDAVTAAEKLKVSDKELEAEYAAMAEKYGMKVEQVKDAASAGDVKTTLLRRKAMEIVKDNAKAGKAKKPAAKKAAEPKAEKKPAAKKTAEPKAEKKPAAKKTAEPKAEKKPAAKKAAEPKAEKKPAAKKAAEPKAEKKPAAKKAAPKKKAE